MRPEEAFWFCGDVSTGKSFMKTYIDNNYQYGSYDGGHRIELEKHAAMYNEEGCAIWDLPLNFPDFHGVSVCIEKFSDFGQKISSGRYAGKVRTLRCHVIVFSNSPPIENLRHRDIVEMKSDGTEVSSSSSVEPPSKRVKIDEVQCSEADPWPGRQFLEFEDRND